MEDVYAELATFCDLKTITALRSTCKVIRAAISERDVDKCILRFHYPRGADRDASTLMSLCCSGTRLELIRKVVPLLVRDRFFFDEEDGFNEFIFETDNEEIARAFPRTKTRHIQRLTWERAFARGHMDVIWQVLKDMPADACVTVPINEAITVQDNELVHFILEKFQPEQADYLLSTAVYTGNVDVAKYLIDTGLEVTPGIMRAAINGASIVMIECLRRRGANFSHQQVQPLRCAFGRYNWHLVEFLLNKGIGDPQRELTRIPERYFKACPKHLKQLLRAKGLPEMLAGTSRNHLRRLLPGLIDFHPQIA